MPVIDRREAETANELIVRSDRRIVLNRCPLEIPLITTPLLIAGILGWQLAARPVVAFAVDGIPEIVEQDVTGILVEPGDVRGLALALDRLTSERAEAERMGVAGRQCALELFGLDDMLDRTEAIYRHMIDG